jgi:hypothetical protein
MANANFSPSMAWKESIDPDEPKLFESFAREIETQQKALAPGPSSPLRGFHAKLHAGLRAEFQVMDNLPAYARQGIFREPRIFNAVVRFSNGDPTLSPDAQPQPRGIAIKLWGVDGQKLLPGQEDAKTQDFLATSHSVTSTVRNAQQFMAFIRASRSRSTLFFVLAREIGLMESMRIIKAVLRTILLSKVTSIATERFSSTAPVKYGPYAVKFTIAPAEGTAQAATVPHPTTDFLRDELARRLQRGYLIFDFYVQFFVDEARTPIEDTSVPWKINDASLLKVGELRVRGPLQDDLSRQVNQLSFTPWHTTEDHRPLGNVMRARRVAYLASAALRGASAEPSKPL